MQQNDPVSSHPEGKMALVVPRLHFVGLREYRTHTGVRHISFHRDLSTGHWMRSSIGQCEADNHGTNPHRLRLDLKLELYATRGMGRPVTTNPDDNRDEQ